MSRKFGAQRVAMTRQLFMATRCCFLSQRLSVSLPKAQLLPPQINAVSWNYKWMHFRIFGAGGIDSFSLVFPFRCSCEKQPVLGALPLAEPDVDNAAPGPSGAFSFLLRPPCRLSFFCPGGSCRSAASSIPLTAFLLWPSPSRRGPRTAKGGLIDHLTCSSSAFIHPSASTFSLTPLYFLYDS